jgi:hypothetical protein
MVKPLGGINCLPQYLNAKAPEHHRVIIKDGALRLSQADAAVCCSRTEAASCDLQDVPCRRRLDFHDIQKTLQAKTIWQTKDPQSAMIKLLTEAEHAVMQFHAMLAGAVCFTFQHSR